jgi:hypothetical protein
MTKGSHNGGSLEGLVWEVCESSGKFVNSVNGDHAEMAGASLRGLSGWQFVTWRDVEAE